jgi:hypothetical protein
MERCNVCAWIMQSVPLEQRAIVRERLGITLVPTSTPDTRTQPHHDASPASKPGRPEPQNNKQQKQQKQQYSNNGGMEPKAVDNSRKAE